MLYCTFVTDHRTSLSKAVYPPTICVRVSVGCFDDMHLLLSVIPQCAAVSYRRLQNLLSMDCRLMILSDQQSILPSAPRILKLANSRWTWTVSGNESRRHREAVTSCPIPARQLLCDECLTCGGTWSVQSFSYRLSNLAPPQFFPSLTVVSTGHSLGWQSLPGTFWLLALSRHALLPAFLIAGPRVPSVCPS